MRAGHMPTRRARRLVATLTVLSILTIAPRATRARDPVLEWNQIALAATVNALSPQGPIPQLRTMTIVHVAVHDAVNAVTRVYRTYLPVSSAPPKASPKAAAIAAAHHALSRLFPAQAESLDAARAASLASHGVTEADAGIGVGTAAAAAILARSATDGFAEAQSPFTAPHAGTRGVWVAIGPGPPVLPGLGRVTPWVLERGSQFRPAGPPALTSQRYARDYNEVKALGSLNSRTRTPQQTAIAQFWLGPPSEIWNGVARQVIETRRLTLSATARVFALMYLAAADASIACWDAKYTFSFWRPLTAIHNGDRDGNDETVGDGAWEPLTTTPQHPEYTSGHTVNSSAMATILTLVFGDNPRVPIVATSSTAPDVSRRWTTLSEGMKEVIDARIYAGFHYRTSDEVGAEMGSHVARFVMNQALHTIPR